MTTALQVDIEVSRLRTAGLLLICCGFVAGCGALLFWSKEGRGGVADGSFGDFGLCVGLVVFGLISLYFTTEMARAGPTISLGSQGIFDRRLSLDWIPWDAIRDVRIIEIEGGRMFNLHLDPAREDALPRRPIARVFSRLNRLVGHHGHVVTGSNLKGGFNALVAAIEASRPPARIG